MFDFKRIQRTGWFALGVIVAVIATLRLNSHFQIKQKPSFPVHVALAPDIVAPLSDWPWPHAVKDMPHAGVTHWLDTSSPDGLTVELFDFDFHANPRLRLELYDQDEDDSKPFDNQVDCFPIPDMNWFLHAGLRMVKGEKFLMTFHMHPLAVR